MSNRAQSRLYTAPHSAGMNRGGGGTSLIDLLTGNTPAKLQKGQQAHEIAIQKMMDQQEKDMAELEAQHEQAKQELLDKLKGNSNVDDAAHAAGVTRDEYINNLMAQASANAQSGMQQKGRIQNSPEFEAANKRGSVATALSPEVKNATDIANASKTQQGGVTVLPNVPGMTGPQDAATVTGGTARQGFSLFGGFPTGEKDANGRPIMGGQRELPITENAPGSVRWPAKQPPEPPGPPPYDPSANVSPTPPPNFGADVNAPINNPFIQPSTIAPTPADKQPISAMPPQGNVSPFNGQPGGQMDPNLIQMLMQMLQGPAMGGR